MIARSAEADGTEMWIEQGDAWLGVLPGAALAYGGTVVARDAQAAWFMRQTTEDDNWPGLPPGTPLVEELLRLDVPGGGIVWLRPANMIVAGECV